MASGRLVLAAVAVAASFAALLPTPARAQAGEELAALDRELVALYVPDPPDPAGAVQRLELLKIRRPNDFRLEAGLAMAYAAIAEKDHDADAARKAQRAGGRSAQINPEHRMAKRGLGIGQLALGRLEPHRRERQDLLLKAAKAFEAAARKASDESWLDHLHRGRALLEAGKAAEALEALEQAREALPAGKPEAALLAAVKAGAQLLAGDVAAAEATLEEAGPVSSAIVPPETRALAPAAPAGGPDPAPTTLTARLGHAYLVAGRAEDALDQAEAALEADARDGFALLLRVKAHQALSPVRPGEAKAAAAALAAAFPDAPWATAAIRAMEDQLSGANETNVAGIPQTADAPPEVQAAAKRLKADDPFERVAAAEELLAHPLGPSIVASHIEREREGFVVGELANLLARKEVLESVASLQRAYRGLGPIDTVARGRVLRALGRLGDPAALPEILRAASEGEGAGGGGGHEVVAGLLTRLDDTARIRFQRSLIESPNPLDRALAPVFATHMIAEKMAQVDAERSRRDAGILYLRAGIGLALTLVGFVRFRLWQRETRLAKLAEEQSKRHPPAHR